MTRKTQSDISREGVDDAFSAIPDLTREELLARWKNAYGRPAPKGISRRTLECAAAYQAQAKIYGKLDPATRRKLARALQGVSSKAAEARSLPWNPILPGTRVVREWRGRSHTVDVLKDGVLYKGQRYRSLSEVARVITGARWSGPRFFGL